MNIELQFDDHPLEERIVYNADTEIDSEPAVKAAANMERNRTAILLLDFQNEFVKKGGKLHDEVAETMTSTGLLQNVPKLVEFAR